MTINLKNAAEFQQMLMKQGYTIRSFAEKANVSQPYLSLILSGKRNPSPKVAKKITEALEAEWNDIFFIATDNKK